jgi:NAD(P)-dependent dehydrogenase (short-subunit alcohol dehydrogenase family)
MPGSPGETGVGDAQVGDHGPGEADDLLVGPERVLGAKELRDTAIKVNAANPGYTATDLNGNSGFRSAAEGAEVSVRLATLDASGPTGTLWGY